MHSIAQADLAYTVQTANGGVDGPGGVCDLDQDKLPSPLRMMVKHSLHCHQFQLNALEEVHVIHTH